MRSVGPKGLEVRNRGSRHGRVAALLLITSGAVCLGNVIASFKDVARLDPVILLARCLPTPEGTVTWTPLETWRGAPPKSPVIIKQPVWARDPVNGLEKDPQVRFLMVVDTQGRSCLSTKIAELPILGDRPTCILPIIKQQLPANFRWLYDHSDGGAMSIQDVKSDLLGSKKTGSGK